MRQDLQRQIGADARHAFEDVGQMALQGQFPLCQDVTGVHLLGHQEQGNSGSTTSPAMIWFAMGLPPR